jgi:NAD(P)-dependent dehydrogenase (short-subunit alcohol dehydrogenase family)
MKPAKFDYVRPQSLEDAVALLAPASIPMGRIAEVEEVANLVVMLASPLMTMVNGTMIEIDGGQDKPLMDRFRDRPKG